MEPGAPTQSAVAAEPGAAAPPRAVESRGPGEMRSPGGWFPSPPPGTAESSERYAGGAPSGQTGPVQLRFNFRFQPWDKVLEWFAEQAGYSLILDAPPTGTFNYSDDRSYTPAEAIDLLNGVLLTKGYTLVLRNRMLILVDLEDAIPPNLVSTVPADELDARGEYELVSTLFQLENMTAEEAQKEIEKLIGPQGSVAVLPKARQLLVTETAGRLRTIRDVIQRADDPTGGAGEEMRWFDVKSAAGEEILNILRQLFNIPAGQTAAADGSIRFAWDPLGMRMLVSGKPSKVEQVAKVLETLDAPIEGAQGAGGAASSALQLEVYDVSPADPDGVLKVMQTLLVGSPGVRLAIDPKTGNLIAMARAEEHATIRATLDQMLRDAQRMEVFQLRTVDPQLAVLAIGRLFAAEGTKAPTVDADMTSRQLIVRGSGGQISQIRSLLEKLGEKGGIGASMAGGGNVRMLPLSGQQVTVALERLREIWPVLHADSQIRIVTPSAVIPSMRNDEPVPGGLPATPPGIIDERKIWKEEQTTPEGGSPSVPSLPTSDKATSVPLAGRARVFLAAQAIAEPSAPSESESFTEPAESPAASVPPSAASRPPIVVAPGPGGLMIASEDEQALQDFETLLNALVGGGDSGEGPRVTIFYLKHAKAAVVSETLNRILSNATTRSTSLTPTTPSPSQPGQSGQSAATPSGMLGYTLGSSSANSSIMLNGPVRVTADPRLNALVVQADPADVVVVEQILRILDQRESPEDILAQAKPRAVPVYNTMAEDIANIVKEIYRDKLATTGNERGDRGPPQNPMEMFQMMRERGGDRGGGDPRSSSRSSGTTADATDRMTVAVDTRTNSVIVSAPDMLFTEVKTFIESLDAAAVDSAETMEVISLHSASPQAVQEALSSLVGDSVTVGGGSSGSSSSSRSSSSRYGSSSRGSDQRPSFGSPFGGFGSPFGGFGGFGSRGSSSSRSSRGGR